MTSQEEKEKQEVYCSRPDATLLSICTLCMHFYKTVFVFCNIYFFNHATTVRQNLKGVQKMQYVQEIFFDFLPYVVIYTALILSEDETFHLLMCAKAHQLWVWSSCMTSHPYTYRSRNAPSGPSYDSESYKRLHGYLKANLKLAI
jgi:hypothetical protein